MRKEKVKTISGEDKDIEVGYLSFEKRNSILSECIEFDAAGTSMSIKKLDYFTLQTKVLKETIKGVDTSQIIQEDGERLFNTYFKHVLESIGGGGEKNLEETSAKP